jgi:hypothetical protein
MYAGEFTDNALTGIGVYSWSPPPPPVFDGLSHDRPSGNRYEGSVAKGLRHGHGIFSTSDGLSYDGEWANGKRHGNVSPPFFDTSLIPQGRLAFTSDGMSYYKGSFVNDVRTGGGKLVYPSGNVYEGDFVDNKRHGTGRMFWKQRNEVYAGEWKVPMARG